MKYNVFKNMKVLLAGSVLARVVGIITIPILTRIYDPSDFGQLAVFVAISLIIVPFGTLMYSFAIPLPKRDSLAINLVVLSFFILFLVTFVVFSVLYFSIQNEWIKFSAILLNDYWWFLPISILLFGFYEIFNYWAIRKHEFVLLAKSKVWQVIVESGVKVVFGLLGYQSVGLFWGYLLMPLGGVLSLMKSFLVEFFLNLKYIKLSKIIFLLNYFREFPTFRLASQVLLMLSMQAPILYSASFYGLGDAGQLSLAFLALALPISLLGSSVAQAYYGEIAKVGRKSPDKVLTVTKDVTKKLFILAIFPFLLLLLGGKWIFELIFGLEWSDAGIYTSILAPYLLAQLVSSPIVNALTLFKKQKHFLLINIRRGVLIVLVCFGTYFFDLSMVEMMVVFSVVLSIHFLLITSFVYKVIQFECLKRQ